MFEILDDIFQGEVKIGEVCPDVNEVPVVYIRAKLTKRSLNERKLSLYAEGL